MDDVILNKVAIIERCLHRIDEEYEGDAKNLANLTKQDSIILNIQRACEASIDLAMHMVRVRRVGVPQDSRHPFVLLQEEGLIPESLSITLQRMVGFRNVAVHDYAKLDLAVVEAVIESHLADLLRFSQIALKSAGDDASQ